MRFSPESSKLVDFVLEQDEIPENSKSYIMNEASTALVNATKIMSSAGYGGWSVEDRNLILENGLGGYKALSAKYKNTGLNYVTNWIDFWENLEKYLYGSRSNRSDILELLRFCIVKDQRVDSIRDLTETLTMGEIDWKEYVEAVKSFKPISADNSDPKVGL